MRSRGNGIDQSFRRGDSIEETGPKKGARVTDGATRTIATARLATPT